MEKEQLREEYEARGDEAVYAEAKRLYEEALAKAPTARLLTDYGYLLECHGRQSIRNAVASYERAMESEPGLDKAHWQLIGARTGLREPERAQSRYRRSLAASPSEAREHRFLATALLAPLSRSTPHDLTEAEAVIAAGLTLAPDDPGLIELRGDLRAASGDPDSALADWRRALELDPENTSAAYSTAFLCERGGRLDAAVEAWRFIVAWCDERDDELSAEWPRRELERLQRESAGGD